uniref:Uncharacterized protein n=1 Tax=viral metagenome TaxID=1070528 RepID=A0A6C0C673_9ZZZZ
MAIFLPVTLNNQIFYTFKSYGNSLAVTLNDLIFAYSMFDNFLASNIE